MKISNWFHCLLWLFLFLVSRPDQIPGLDDPEWSRESLSDGVELYQRHFDSLYGAPQYISIIVADLEEPGIELGIAAAARFDKPDLPLSVLGENAGAIAAVNGGFMHGGPEKMNSGILKVDDKMLPFFEDEPDALEFVGSSAIGVDRKGNLHFKKRKGSHWDKNEWTEMKHMIAGGHLLIYEGAKRQKIIDEGWKSDRERNHAGNRHPRTAMGLVSGSKAILVTADGRHEQAEGLTLRELALFMHELDCIYAINMDGGGSTTMWTNQYGVVNHPSGNRNFDSEGLRAVRTAITIQKKY